MAGLDRRLTGIFRASLPNDEGLSRILSPATLAAEAAGMTRQSIIIIKSLDPLRVKKTFIRKKLGHTMVSAIKASSVTL